MQGHSPLRAQARFASDCSKKTSNFAHPDIHGTCCSLSHGLACAQLGSPQAEQVIPDHGSCRWLPIMKTLVSLFLTASSHQYSSLDIWVSENLLMPSEMCSHSSAM